MWWRMAPITRSACARGTRSRRRTSVAISAETRSWPKKWPSCRVSGLADVVEERGEPHDRRVGRSCRVHGPQRVIEGVAGDGLRLRDAAKRGELGRTTTRSPSRSSRPMAPDGTGSSASIRRSSSRTRSAETEATVGASSRIAASVPGSIASSKRPANRAARMRRRASSAKRSSGSPTARSRRASRSAWPPCGSTNAPRPASRSIGSQAMALIVKSRRARSSVSETPNRTSSGRRRSRYAPSARYEVISTRGCAPIVTVPKRFSQVAPSKRATTSSGRAAVAASHSPRGAMPSSRSRTTPPTSATSCPASVSVRSTWVTRSGRLA